VHQEGQLLGEQQLGICTELNSSAKVLSAGHSLTKHDGSFLTRRLAVKRHWIDPSLNARNTKQTRM